MMFILFQKKLKRNLVHRNLTSGSNRSLSSLGRAKARPLTKRYVFNQKGVPHVRESI